MADCFFFDSSLHDRWSAEALKWACCAASRHAASRSHQVFCALAPSITSAACTALLAALQKCLHSASAQGLDTAVEILCTLRVLLANAPPQKLVLYPHVFAACIALLCSSVVRVGELAAALLIQILDAVDLTSPVVQTALTSVLPLDIIGEHARSTSPSPQQQQQQQQRNGGTSTTNLRKEKSQSQSQRVMDSLWPLGYGLLANAPDVEDDDAAGGPWLSLQQLLVKGLYQPETEALALEGMAAIARQLTAAGARGRLQSLSSSRNSSSFIMLRDSTNSLILSKESSSASAAASLRVGGESTAYTSGGGGGGIMSVEMVVGDAKVGLAISLGAALPWICVHVGAGELADTVASFLSDLSSTCAAVGWEELAAVLAVLSAGPPPTPPGAGAAAWLPDLAEALCTALFPTYSRIVVHRLMETVQRGDERYQAAALCCLGAVFRVPGLPLGSPQWFVQGSHLVELLSTEVGGPLGPQVLDVLQALAQFHDDGGCGSGSGVISIGGGGASPLHHHQHHHVFTGEEEEEEEKQAQQQPVALEWRLCMDDLGESNKVCVEALRRVVEACPGSAELARATSGFAVGTASGGGGGGRGGDDVMMNNTSEQLLPFLPSGMVAGGGSGVVGW